jgi:hypothetical protein
MSILKSKNYGDGRKEGKFRNGSFMESEKNGGLPSGIRVQGQVTQLEGQPPMAVSNGWGDLHWMRPPPYVP